MPKQDETNQSELKTPSTDDTSSDEQLDLDQLDSNSEEASKDEADGAADEKPIEESEHKPETPPKKAFVMKSGMWERFRNWSASWWANPRKRWGTVAGVVVLLGVVFGVPFTRYNVLGLALRAPVTVQVVDSKTGKPVSGAKVELGGKMAETDATGKAKLSVHTGSKTLAVSKKYYRGGSQGQLVALSGNIFTAKLVATGRQVEVKLVNKVSGKPVSGVTIAAGGAKAKSDKKGLATLVLSSGIATQNATLSLGGYNNAKVVIAAEGNLAKNTFNLVPAGKLYFLSNLSGKLDVVKTDLDGSNRQVVLAGTGSEDKGSTSLLASRDWKYLALLSRRSGEHASVYLIDTANGDKLTTIDEGDANFSLSGWNGNHFVYRVNRNSVKQWEPRKQALKSFDATTGHTLLLDQTQGSGSAENNYAQQSFGDVYLIGDKVVYTKNWNGYAFNVPDGRPAELHSIGVDGSGHKVVKSFQLTDYMVGYTYASVSLQTRPEGYDGFRIIFYNGNPEYYRYEDGKVTGATDLKDSNFYENQYNTYLLSPSGNSTFWGEDRDGKNTLFVGDNEGENEKTVASLSEYNIYGWYSDDYLLVSKKGSELYILPTAGGTPFKITDYYKPSISYYGYGGGYGGL
jgi:hypothetical protein